MMKQRLPNSKRKLNLDHIIQSRQDRLGKSVAVVPFYKSIDVWPLIAGGMLSIGAFLFFYFSNQQNLADYDAIARLNIARKIIDSITPGFAQLGGIWLPFPQVLFLPFIWSDFMWHTGLAGAISSMISFTLGAFFVYKTVLLITGNRIGAFLSWIVYVTNVNMLFLQSMAMSESFFLFTLVMIVYFMTKWAKSRNILHLLYCAFFCILTTLTRYEGYVLFASATLSVMVLALAIYSHKEKQKVQGVVIFFTTLAGFGIFLWAFYSFLIFKDPVYWLNLYMGNKQVIATDAGGAATGQLVGEVADHTRRVSFLNAANTYTRAMFYMNGIVVSLLAAFAFSFLIFKNILNTIVRRVDIHLIPITIMTLSLLLFVFFGYWKGLIPNIEVPLINAGTIVDKTFNISSSSNIRYGIIMLPLMALVIGLFYGRYMITGGIALGLLLFQLYSIFFTPLFLVFSMPVKMQYKQLAYAQWFRENYDGGMILVSAHRHENFIYQTGLPYETFVYEGTRQWWTNSLTEPTRHATWVVLDESIPGDAVNELLINRDSLNQNFELVHQDLGLKIYKKM